MAQEQKITQDTRYNEEAVLTDLRIALDGNVEVGDFRSEVDSGWLELSVDLENTHGMSPAEILDAIHEVLAAYPGHGVQLSLGLYIFREDDGVDFGELQEIIDHGSIVQVVIDGQFLAADGNMMRRAIADSGVAIGDMVSYETDGIMLVSFAPVDLDEDESIKLHRGDHEVTLKITKEG